MIDHINKDAPFKIISLMFEGHFTKEEMLKKLDISSTNFYRSINALRCAGFQIRSTGLMYHIYGHDYPLVLNEYEKSLLAYMLNLAFVLLPIYKMLTFKNMIRRLMRFGAKDDYNEIIKRFQFFKINSLQEEFAEKITSLKKYMDQEASIKVILNSGKIIFMRPRQFDWERERIYVYYMNLEDINQKEEAISIEKIVKIVEEDEEEYTAQNDEVIFELYGRLAKSYLLKRDERAVESTKTSLVVASGAKDKEVLFKRLMRYDTMCKVLQTKKDVEAFKSMIQRALDNIDAKPDPDAYDDSWEQTS